MLKKILVFGAAGCLALFIVLQLLPVARDHTPPPIVQEPQWDSATTRALAVRACFDCHSSETTWPWYSNIAPVSWLIAKDVADGRQRYSFSDWQPGDVHPQRAAKVVRERTMPPSRYLMLHPEAKLTDAEIEQLALGFVKSLQPPLASTASD